MDVLKNFKIKNATDDDVNLISKKKTRLELIRLSLIVCGIEFCYAAETAFVSPILLKIGVPVQYMTMIWCLSPFFGFFICPLLGAVSDTCSLRLGRRRPFIIFYSIGIIFGLLFVSYGTEIGMSLGDVFNLKHAKIHHPFIILITIIGVFLLDFNCDACQSPSRAYLIDVCLKEDHSVGLAMFTIMAGAGGFFGYIIGGIPWEHLFEAKINVNSLNATFRQLLNLTDDLITTEAQADSKHIHILFTFVLVIYIIFAILTLTSFKEINVIGPDENRDNYEILTDEPCDRISIDYDPEAKLSFTNKSSLIESVKENLRMSVRIPRHLLLLCLTNFFCWSSLICYSLYFTDFVAQEIFGGRPHTWDTHSYALYERGVQYGSICMGIYSATCSVYSYSLDKLIKRFTIKRVYILSQLVYSLSMIVLAFTKHKVTAAFISIGAGVMYSTLFTIPYILVATYHTQEAEIMIANTQQTDENDVKRGLGADISLVGSMVFLAQFTISLFIGTFIKLFNTNTVIVYSASLFAFCGSISANFLLYTDQ